MRLSGWCTLYKSPPPVTSFEPGENGKGLRVAVTFPV